MPLFLLRLKSQPGSAFLCGQKAHCRPVDIKLIINKLNIQPRWRSRAPASAAKSQEQERLKVIPGSVE
jgi:hypothetical protein